MHEVRNISAIEQLKDTITADLCMKSYRWLLLNSDLGRDFDIYKVIKSCLTKYICII